MVKGLTTLITLGTTVTGLWKTMGDESLSAGEKAERFFTTALTMLPMIIMIVPNYKN